LFPKLLFFAHPAFKGSQSGIKIPQFGAGRADTERRFLQP